MCFASKHHCLIFSGPIVGVMLRHLSCRTVTLLGTLLLSTGFCTSMFAESLGVLYVTLGIVSGELMIAR